MNNMTKIIDTRRGVTLEQRAHRIRALTTTVWTCVIEIGMELHAARDEIGGGDRWLAWLEREFYFSTDTAAKFMAVAQTFGELVTPPSISDIREDATIDLMAMYKISQSRAIIDDETRKAVAEEAVTRAKAGEHITKAKAQQMIDAAIARITGEKKQAEHEKKRAEDQLRDERAAKVRALDEAKHEMREALAKLQAERRAELQDTIETATKAAEAQFGQNQQNLLADRETLKKEVGRLKAAMDAKPQNDDEMIGGIHRLLGIKKMSASQATALATILNRGITYKGTTYKPVSASEANEIEENARIAGEITEGLAKVADAPTAAKVLKLAMPIHRSIIRDHIDDAERWIKECKRALADYSDEED